MGWLSGISTLVGLGLQGLGLYKGIDANEKNIQSQENINQINWANQQAMLEKQRKFALEDFNMQNKYNSPEQVMQRYKEAGLNPNLIYGHGTQANASTIRSTDTPVSKAIAPQHDASIASNALFNMGQMSTDFVSNLTREKQLELLGQEINNKKAIELKTLAEVDTKQWDLSQKYRFKDLMWNKISDEAWLIKQRGITQENINQNYLSLQNAQKKQLAELSKIDASAKHAMELYNLASKENVLKQNDIETLDALFKSREGKAISKDAMMTIIAILKIALGRGK